MNFYTNFEVSKKLMEMGIYCGSERIMVFQGNKYELYNRTTNMQRYEYPCYSLAEMAEVIEQIDNIKPFDKKPSYRSAITMYGFLCNRWFTYKNPQKVNDFILSLLEVKNDRQKGS
jgi:hypothetical protein